jgi:hypothetical protein
MVAVTVVADLTVVLEQTGEAPVVVLHCSAETALTGAMSQGAVPSTALASWRAVMSAQLAVLRRHRRRITLVDVAALSDHRAPGMLDRLARRLGLDVVQTTGPLARVPSMADPSPVVTALALMCLADSPEIQGLLSELDALLLRPSDRSTDDPAVDTEGLADAAFAAHVELLQDAGRMRAERALLLDHMAEAQAQLAEARCAARAGAGLDTWVRERDLLLDQLDHMQQQMEQVPADAETDLRLLEENRREPPARHTAVERARRDVLLGDEILRLSRAECALQDQLAERDAELADTRRELAAVYASRSWRITGPMRMARFAVTKKANPDG